MRRTRRVTAAVLASGALSAAVLFATPASAGGGQPLPQGFWWRHASWGATHEECGKHVKHRAIIVGNRENSALICYGKGPVRPS